GGEGRGIRREALRGTVQYDILKEYVARSTYIYPPDPSMRLALDVIEFCSHEVPRWNAISVSGYHIREAGATAVQEIGFTLANGIAYLDEAVARGLDVDSIAPQISFFFNAHIDLLEEVAKLRAARRLWRTVLPDRVPDGPPRGGGRRPDPRSGPSGRHAQGDRVRLGPAAGRGFGVPLSGRARTWGADGRRRECFPRGGRADPDPQDEPQARRRTG